MKKFLLLGCIIYSATCFGQKNNYDLIRSEIENIKSEITLLKSDINSIKSENIYLKKIQHINTPITEKEEDNSVYKITKVTGNNQNKTISIEFLVEAKDENKKATFQSFSLVDLEGNEYQIDFGKSSNIYPRLSVNAPMKVQVTFSKVLEKPEYIRVFRFSTENRPERNSFDSSRSRLEFRDLKVNWK